MKKLALLVSILTLLVVFIGCTSGITTPGTGTGTGGVGGSQTPLQTQKFHVKWYFKIGPFKNLYVPIPISDHFQPYIENVKLSPEPYEIYNDSKYGNKIAHYKDYDESVDFSLEFDITLQKGRQNINISDIGQYDTTSEIYTKYMGKASYIQIDNPILIQAAKEIVGDETNPYKKAKLIQRYIASHIGPPQGEWHDALTTYLNSSSACDGRAALFVALCRIEGIPARIVSGLHRFKEGTWVFDWQHNKEEYGIHVWAEAYLPKYGWVFVDPGDPDGFANIYEYRIKLSRGADIQLDPEANYKAEWFHIPIRVDSPDVEYTHNEIDKQPLYLSITKIQ